MPSCTSCGSFIPEGQGSSCSMCYGDVAHGRDRYYEQWIEERVAEEQRQQEEHDSAALDRHRNIQLTDRE